MTGRTTSANPPNPNWPSGPCFSNGSSTVRSTCSAGTKRTTRTTFSGPTTTPRWNSSVGATGWGKTFTRGSFFFRGQLSRALDCAFIGADEYRGLQYTTNDLVRLVRAANACQEVDAVTTVREPQKGRLSFAIRPGAAFLSATSLLRWTTIPTVTSASITRRSGWSWAAAATSV